MNYPTFEAFATFALPIASVLVAIITICALVKMRKEKQKICIKRGNKECVKNVMPRIFTIFAAGYLTLAAADIYWNYLYYLTSMTPDGIANIIWAAGYVLILIAFSYFGLHMHKSNKRSASGIVLFLIVAALIGTLTFLALKQELTVDFFNYLYPIVSSLILIVSLMTYGFFKDSELRAFSTPLLFLAISNAFRYFGDLLYAYSLNITEYGMISVVSDSFYLATSLFAVYGFYKLLKA